MAKSNKVRQVPGRAAARAGAGEGPGGPTGEFRGVPERGCRVGMLQGRAQPAEAGGEEVGKKGGEDSEHRRGILAKEETWKYLECFTKLGRLR